MVAVVIIGALAAMALPTYRRITMRSKTAAVVNDFRTFSTALITYNLQNGRWPADGTAKVIPPELAGALPNGFELKSPIGGVYKWNFDVSGGLKFTPKASISIETSTDFSLTEDSDLLKMIDSEIDDGDLDTGNVQYTLGSLVYIIEK
jgi:type II secretory pathway pseudopilin PulG